MDRKGKVENAMKEEVIKEYENINQEEKDKIIRKLKILNNKIDRKT